MTYKVWVIVEKHPEGSDTAIDIMPHGSTQEDAEDAISMYQRERSRFTHELRRATLTIDDEPKGDA